MLSGQLERETSAENRLIKLRFQITNLRDEIKQTENSLLIAESQRLVNQADSRANLAPNERPETRLMAMSYHDSIRANAAIQRMEAKVIKKEAELLLAPVKAKTQKHGSDQVKSQIDLFEQLVESREMQAQDSRQLLTGISAAEQTAIDNLANGFEIAVKQFYATAERLSKLGSALNTNVEHAYQQLVEQLKEAHALASTSYGEDEKFVKEIARLRVRDVDFAERLAKLHSHQKSAEYKGIQTDRASNEQQIGKLQDALRAHQQSNVRINQRLFGIDNIVRRIQSVKLLLSALPPAKTELEKFSALVIEVTGYLQKEFQSGGYSESKSANMVNFEDRIDRLENNVQMIYIKLVKGEVELPRGTKTTNFQQALSHMSAAIALEHKEQQVALEKWSAIAAQAEMEGKELLSAVANQRSALSASAAKSFERSLDVLALTSNKFSASRLPGK